MGLLLAVSRIYLPRSVRVSRLLELFEATADAFRRQTPFLDDMPFNRFLTEYALFTRDNAEKSIREGSEQEVRERLYSNALRIGRSLRKELGVRTQAEAMQACEVVYKAIKIEFHGDAEGLISIPRCFFSSFYSSQVCRVISGLDEGIIEGLSGGLKLDFSQRITEGHRCCVARLSAAGSPL